MIGFSFAFDWLIDCRKCLRPRTRRSEAKLMQSPNKDGNFLKNLWCCVGEGYHMINWFYGNRSP